jgi:hypothetical protein
MTMLNSEVFTFLNKLPVTTEIQNQNATYAGNTGVVADAFRTFYNKQLNLINLAASNSQLNSIYSSKLNSKEGYRMSTLNLEVSS